jgi:hypothetical protein
MSNESYNIILKNNYLLGKKNEEVLKVHGVTKVDGV